MDIVADSCAVIKHGFIRWEKLHIKNVGRNRNTGPRLNIFSFKKQYSKNRELPLNSQRNISYNFAPTLYHAILFWILIHSGTFSLFFFLMQSPHPWTYFHSMPNDGLQVEGFWLLNLLGKESLIGCISIVFCRFVDAWNLHSMSCKKINYNID